MNFIPYGHHTIDQGDIDEVVSALKSEWITAGPKVKNFEDELNAYIGSKYSVAVNSGTSALDIAIKSLNIPNKSEIITTPLTFVATSNAILYNNLTPIFADIDPKTKNINPEEVKKKITNKTKAIIGVDFAGHPCNIKELKEIADEYDLFFVEDACHALGAEYCGKKVGNLADMTIFSFHPVKNITTGEGGAVIARDPILYQKLLMLRNHGIDKDSLSRFGNEADYAYDMKCLGRNYRLTDFQSALGISQLKKLDTFIQKRHKIAKAYNDLLRDERSIECPYSAENVRHAWHIYTILVDKDINRDRLFAELRRKMIGVNVHYIPIYHFTYYKDLFKLDPICFPVTEDIYNRTLTLPLFPELNEEHVIYIVNTLKKVLKECKY